MIFEELGEIKKLNIKRQVFYLFDTFYTKNHLFPPIQKIKPYKNLQIILTFGDGYLKRVGKENACP